MNNPIRSQTSRRNPFLDETSDEEQKQQRPTAPARVNPFSGDEQGAGAQDMQPTKGATPLEHLTGLTRQAANVVTFGKYPEIVGAANRLTGGPNAEEIRRQMEAYREEYPISSGAARVAGTAAQYVGGGGLLKAGAKAAGAIPGVGRALQMAEQGYGKIREAVPLASKLLPASGRTAAEITAIEGTRNIAEAPEGATAGEIAARTAMALPFGRAGETVGAYVAGKAGPTVGETAERLLEATAKAGEKISAWKQGAPVPITGGLSRLYGSSKLIKDAIDQEASDLGKVANDPLVLARAYSRVSEAVRGTKDAADVQNTVLQPFLREIDAATGGGRPLSPLIRQYAEAIQAEKAATLGQEAMRYIRTRQGDPFKVSPEVVARRLTQPYATAAARQAAAATLADELARGVKTQGAMTVPELARRAVAPLRGAGKASELIELFGGMPTARQRAVQSALTGTGAQIGSRFYSSFGDRQ